MRPDASQRLEASSVNRTKTRPEIKFRGRIGPRALLLFFSSHDDGCNAVRPDDFSFSFFFSPSIKHIWLRTIGGFGFLIHSDFLVEVVVVLRAVGGGGCGCGFLGLSLVVVDEGFAIGGGGAGFEE